MKLCVDCIHVGVCYRQGAVDLNYADKCGDYEVIHKGHWIAHSNGGIWIKYYECSECHKYKGEKTDFCPNCGAEMVEPQESEDKE